MPLHRWQMILALDKEELVEAPGVAPFFTWGLHIRQFTYPKRKCRCERERLWIGMLLKLSPIIRPESLVLFASLYFTFCLYGKMIQLGKITPFFVIKNVLDITI